MGGITRRSFLSSAIIAVFSGCSSFDPDSDHQTTTTGEIAESKTSKRSGTTGVLTETPTPTPVSSNRPISIDNYSEMDITIHIRVIEYTHAPVPSITETSVTTSPDQEEGTTRIHTEMSIEQGAERTVENAFILDNERRRYYVSVQGESVGREQIVFSIDRDSGFRYLQLSLMPKPEFTVTVT